MATNCGDLKENGCELESFEKNNYFYGKLISARDMTLEQRTNERKLYTINRLVLGSGLVCGLEVTKVEEINNDLMVSIQPGLAIDGYGRLIVVSEPKIVKAISDGNKDTGSSDTLYLYLKYRNCSTEYVPVSGNDDACQEKCCYNRIREVFDIVYSTTNVVTDERKKKEIAFITEILEDFKKDAKLEKLDLAQKYYKDILMSGCVKTSELVLLGVFKKGGDKIWSPDTDNRYASCSIVYDNVMLYNIINVLKEEINELRKKINTISIPTSKVKVPDVVGDDIKVGKDKIDKVGLIMGVKYKATTDANLHDKIKSQEPAAGSTVDIGTTVYIVVYEKVYSISEKVPDFIGDGRRDLNSVIEAIKKTGLKMGTVTDTEGIDDKLAGLMYRQEPVAGAEIPEERTVNIWRYKIIPKATVLDVVGDDIKVAEDKINKVGLKMNATYERTQNRNLHDKIKSQEPVAGSIVNIGTTVHTVVYRKIELN